MTRYQSIRTRNSVQLLAKAGSEGAPLDGTSCVIANARPIATGKWLDLSL